MGHSPFGPMQNFFITVPGVNKLLRSLKIHEAAGPDGIVPRLLYELSEQQLTCFSTHIYFQKIHRIWHSS